MTNREKLAALVSENAERILANEALRFDHLSDLYCDRSPLYPDGCDGGDCVACFKAWLDAQVADDLHYEDGFLYPPNTGFIIVGGDAT